MWTPGFVWIYTATAAAIAGGVSETQADALEEEEPLSETDLAILQVVLQPARLADMQTLLDGLDQLARADPAASTRTDEQGIDFLLANHMTQGGQRVVAGRPF